MMEGIQEHVPRAVRSTRLQAAGPTEQVFLPRL